MHAWAVTHHNRGGKKALCRELTQVPVRQRIVVVVLIIVYVLPFLALPALVLQGDGAGLVEAGLDVLLTVGDRFILFNVTLKDNSEGGERREDSDSALVFVYFWDIETESSILGAVRDNWHTCTEC